MDAGGPTARGLRQPDRRKRLTSRKKVLNVDSGLSKNGAKRSFRHISGVTRYGNFSTGTRMTPNFVAA